MFSQEEMTKAIKHAGKVSKRLQDGVLDTPKGWVKYVTPVELPDKDMKLTMSFWKKENSSFIDISQTQVSGDFNMICDEEILKRMSDRRVRQPFWSLVNRALSVFNRE
jgi:hypothetical protein